MLRALLTAAGVAAVLIAAAVSVVVPKPPEPCRFPDASSAPGPSPQQLCLTNAEMGEIVRTLAGINERMRQLNDSMPRVLEPVERAEHSLLESTERVDRLIAQAEALDRELALELRRSPPVLYEDPLDKIPSSPIQVGR